MAHVQSNQTTKRRRAALAAAAKQAHCQALLVSRPEDVGYLTGFTGDDSVAMVGRAWACLLTDGRYDEQARKECPDIDIHLRRGSMAKAIAEVAAERGIRSLAVQSEHITLQAHARLTEAMGRRKILPAEGVMDALRARKDPQEIQSIRRAIGIGQRAFRELISAGASGLVGRTEQDLAAELDWRMRRLGASGVAFETIVAAGANSSRPHHRPTRRRVGPGMPVLIDWGARVDGYCGDLTRVVFTGRIPPKLAEIYEVVLRAQAVAIEAIRPGKALGAVDAAARQVVEKAGYGRFFVHGLGHGIGRAVHEAPSVSATAGGRLRPGVVVTVEPGIYLPGLGGVRIEDDVEVTAAGCRRLSSLPRQIAAMRLG